MYVLHSSRKLNLRISSTQTMVLEVYCSKSILDTQL